MTAASQWPLAHRRILIHATRCCWSLRPVYSATSKQMTILCPWWLKMLFRVISAPPVTILLKSIRSWEKVSWPGSAATNWTIQHRPMWPLIHLPTTGARPEIAWTTSPCWVPGAAYTATGMTPPARTPLPGKCWDSVNSPSGGLTDMAPHLTPVTTWCCGATLKPV